MGWRINLVKNDLPLAPEACAEINALNHHRQIKAYDGKLVFDRDHLEWMDYVNEPELLAVLERHKVNGEILWSSSEGDNRGERWGYRFVDGAMTKITGETLVETNDRPTDLAKAKRGDTVAVACIYAGLTSYESAVVGDILDDGTLVVDGREFKAPGYRVQGDMGFAFRLHAIDDPVVDLEEDDAAATG